MQHLVHPPSVIEHTTEAYLPQVTVRGQLIYCSVALAIVAALVSLPFIHTEISVQSAGIIRPVAERNELRPLVAGTVAQVLVHDNQPVRQGQPMIRLQTEVLETKLRLNHSQQAEKLLNIRDLDRLVRATRPNLLSVSGLQSPVIRQQYEQFRFLLTENTQTQQKRKRELDVTRQLYEDKVLAQQEFEDKEFTYKTVVAQYASQIERQVSDWQASLTQQQLALDELRAQERQLLNERDLHTIKAPVAGTVSQLTGRYPGSYVQPGEVLGVVSPDSNLLVECYVSPKDIGLLRPGMTARMQIDAFDYNQWGLVQGTVTEVSNDITVMENRPVFKVKCKLDQNFLCLKEGYKGYLKKGMTIRARFVITERSLFDLLYDKADDWLNPKNTALTVNSSH
ncbi:HlyD family efflux transporter periplasmic adaptor subunit [Spirosoma sp. KCTC 42546]|uniref:HlyD family secretion protein n=1 Tax=Spirosoma sp. KCTC 42546 TaxID=2520506 RepID=UPI001157FDDE|nr:HlyD family efflux transporter periplasmic adaptor subunit [Spirosoma sp. KCTC 42546]QDK82402.1 HlyD family efflux transporter periplasmic adaptor subunit [Spirosoma sp. KCTC 42546]